MPANDALTEVIVPNALVMMIYFPSATEGKAPYVIYVLPGLWNGTEYRGSRLEQEVREGRHGTFPASRCQPYSPLLWKAVEAWIRERDRLKADYEDLMRGRL